MSSFSTSIQRQAKSSIKTAHFCTQIRFSATLRDREGFVAFY
jgi:hypothetical protein